MGSSVGLAEGDLDGAVVGAAVVLGAGVGAVLGFKEGALLGLERSLVWVPALVP